VTGPPAASPPAALVVAAVLVGLEGLVLALLGMLELASLNSSRATMAITTAAFFLVLGAGLGWCALGLVRVRSWARGPVVACQLIGVLLSFSFWGGQTTLTAVGILVVCVATLAGVLNPASTRALAADEG
jgi:hypothetical protein